MDDEKNQILWRQLQHTEGPIPWPVLDEFADALVKEPSIWHDLAGRYNELALCSVDYFGYEQLYIPAIFAKVAPRLDRETILDMALFLVEKLCEAGFDDDDIQLEVSSAACGSMGVVILPTVMDFIYKEENTYGAWFFLWGLLRLAKQADESMRKQVIDFCVDFLELADRDVVSLSDADCAADVLAYFGCTEYLGLLKRLEKKSRKTLCYGEYRELVRILQGRQKPYDFPEMWEQPVEQWLPVRWKRYKEWYEEDKKAGITDYEEFDIQHYKAGKLTWRFLRSADAAEKVGNCYEDVSFILGSLLDYAWTYESAPVEELNEQVLEEVLFSIFPRKVAAGEDLFKNVAPITAAFLSWLEKQDVLASGQKLAAKVVGWSEQIVDNGMNPANWSMGKSFTMKAEANGVDVTDQKELQRYMIQHNLRMSQEQQITRPLLDDSFDDEPPFPISEIPAKVGRNEPCPCGSGKKYKKCCGSLNAANRDF